MGSSDHIVMAALGRSFTLGKLYDARKDVTIHGQLWSDDTIKKNTVESSHSSSTFQMSTSDSLEEKSSLLDIEASMRASFLSGLVEVGGSAKYLNDKKKSKKQVRFTLQYKATTEFKHLSMTYLDANSTKLAGGALKGTATHVVTGILYGANAVFVFDNDNVESNSVRDIQSKVRAVINKIPMTSVEGEVSLQMKDEEKSLMNNFSSKYYGDVILKHNPTNFEDALQAFQNLPEMFHKSGDNCCVPIKVWLTPLKMFDPNAAQLKSEICIGLVRKAENAIEDLEEMEMRCSECLEELGKESFTQVKKDLTKFKQLCNDYVGELKQTMRDKFPSIRDGKEDNNALEKVFDRNGSPFSQDKLDKWMEGKEREVTIIKSCVNIMKDATIVLNKSDLDAKLLGLDVEHALCFTFTSVSGPDPYLDELERVLHSHDCHSNKNITHAMQDQWYTSDVSSRMRDEAKTFQSLAKTLKNSRVRFLVAAIENEKYKGASIYHYKRGVLITDDFSLPPHTRVPAVETIKDKIDLIWYACDLTLDPNTVNNYLGLSEENKKVTIQSWQRYPEHPERFGPQIYQVLCKEGLTGRCYWEVEWSQNKDEGLAVAYKQDGFQAINFGSQSTSWYLYQCGNNLYAKHNDTDEICGSIDPAGCRRVGVYLDWSAGTLSFYRVSTTTNTLTHLHTFRTSFTEPVYPGFYLYTTSTYASLPPVV